MRKQGFSFEFSLPADWREVPSGGSSLLFSGPMSEEVIVSGTLIAGPEDPALREVVRERVVKNALAGAAGAASHPELNITRGLDRHIEGRFDCWTLEAESTDGQVFFGEFIAAGDVGVLLATFEAGNTTRSKQIFKDLVASVEEVRPQ